MTFFHRRCESNQHTLALQLLTAMSLHICFSIPTDSRIKSGKNCYVRVGSPLTCSCRFLRAPREAAPSAHFCPRTHNEIFEATISNAFDGQRRCRAYGFVSNAARNRLDRTFSGYRTCDAARGMGISIVSCLVTVQSG